jgi:hypothetical protein
MRDVRISELAQEKALVFLGHQAKGAGIPQKSGLRKMPRFSSGIRGKV